MDKSNLETFCEELENGGKCGIVNDSTNSDENDNDTLEAEISRLEATLNELEDDLPEMLKSTEEVDDIDLAKDIGSCEEITEKTITNSSINFEVQIYKEMTKPENNFKKQNCSGEKSQKTENLTLSPGNGRQSKSPEKNQTNIYTEVLCTDQHKMTDLSVISNKKEGSKLTSVTTAHLDSQKTLDNRSLSSEYLSIFPSIDSEFETLVQSPLTSGVEGNDSDTKKKCSIEFSPFNRLKNKWFTSSPKVDTSEEYQHMTIPFPSMHNNIQMILESAQQKSIENKKADLGIMELLSNSPKLTTVQDKTKYPSGCNLECQSSSCDNESNFNQNKVLRVPEPAALVQKENSAQTTNEVIKTSSGSFLELDVSQDYEKEWVISDQEYRSGSDAGPVSSTPYRKKSFSSLANVSPGFQHSRNFLILDETGKADGIANENEISEPTTTGKKVRNLCDSVQKLKSKAKTVELDEDLELNVSVKHKCAGIVHSPESVDVNKDKNTEHEAPFFDDRVGEEYVKIQVIKSDYLFTSEDPQENADNFNPEWELLRKLQTDEERYKAMRERWRNLIIPNPNQDLTHFTWRLQKNKSTTLPSKCWPDTQTTCFTATKPTVELHHKRTLSDPGSSSEDRRTKRARTQSCTMLFDVKLQKLKQEINNEQQRLCTEEAQVVQNLRMAQAEQKVQLQHYYHGYQIFSELHQLHHQYLQNEELIHMQYEGARTVAETSQERKINALENASAEVRTFHKFYQGLENKEDNDTSAYLSESQLEELWETENFYEECEKLYV